MSDEAARAGDGVRELVEVMDLLRSPGGCPWDAAQTHESLVPFVLEEAHEVAEAIEGGDRAGMREELGDLLLQVVFHARLAQEHAHEPFDLDDVARGVAAKLVRRHPHVFAGAQNPSGDGQVQWDRIKTADKQRTSVLEGIPLAQGALARAQKVLSRAARAGLAVTADESAAQHVAQASPDARAALFGARLLLLAAEADAAGVDAEAALRAALRTLESAVRAAEAG